MIWNCEKVRLRMTKCAINTMIPNFSRPNSIIEPHRLGKCLLHLLRQYHLFHDGTYVDQNNISVFFLREHYQPQRSPLTATWERAITTLKEGAGEVTKWITNSFTTFIRKSRQKDARGSRCRHLFKVFFRLIGYQGRPLKKLLTFGSSVRQIEHLQ